MRQLLLIFVMLLVGCHTPKKAGFCSVVANVIKSDLDGCGLLLQLRNKKKLLPINAKSFNFDVGQKVMISYDASDAMSICMYEDEIVHLTCLHILSRADCQDDLDGQRLPWINRVISDWKPTTIDKYTYLGVPIYHCKKIKESKWYDCHGNILTTQDDEVSSNLLESKLEIWVAHR